MDISYKTIEDPMLNDWIVFIHGFGGSGNMFKKQTERMKEKFNLLLIDLPGHGESRRGLKIGDFSIDDVARKIIAKMEELHIKSADFVGISLGTLIIAAIADVDSSFIKKAILGGAICGMDSIYKRLIKVVDKIKIILPHQIVARLFAMLMMPKKNHKFSRKCMIKEIDILPQLTQWDSHSLRKSTAL